MFASNTLGIVPKCSNCLVAEIAKMYCLSIFKKDSTVQTQFLKITVPCWQPHIIAIIQEDSVDALRI